MENTHSKERGRGRRGEQVFRGRCLENNHPGRNTTNSQKAFAGPPEDSRGFWSSSPEQKRSFKTFRHQVDASERLNIPRCTSPMPFQQTTPQPSLPVPKLQTRSQYQRHNIPALTGTVKIMKRHTSPYPTPASSPKNEVLVDSSSPPRRAYTCPVPVPDLTGKYKEKMDMFLKSDLISKVDPLQGPQFAGDATDRELVPEHGAEADPVPDFFVGPAHVRFGTAPGVDSTWINGGPNSEHDLMNNDFIGTLGSVQDLDEDMRDYLPGAYSEYFPGPEAPIQEGVTPVVVLQNMDLENLTGPVGFQNSETAVAPRFERGAAITNQKEGNQLLNTPQSLLNDSGAGMSSPPGCQFPNKDPNIPKENISGSTSAAQLEVLKPRLQVIPCDSNQSFPTEELTPPNSAYLSPSPSFNIFPPKKQESPAEAKKLALGSIATIQTLILDPIMKNPALQEFWGLCKHAKEEMQNGKIGSLKDVESMFLTTHGRRIATSSRSYQQFANASLKGIAAAAGRIPDCDLRRSYDPGYDASYFTDKIHEVNQVCVEGEEESGGNDNNQSAERITAEWGVIHGEKSIRDVTPAQRGDVALAQETTQRRISGTPDRLLPSAEESMISPTTPLVTTHKLNDQQKRPFIGPNVQQARQLEIQTQSLGDLNTYSHPHLPQHFTYDQSTGNAVAQVQSHNCHRYHDGCSEMLPLATSQFSVPVSIGFYPPPTPVSAEPPTTVHSFAERISGSTRSKGSLPGLSPNKQDETPPFTCERCEKRFPRPCDLTKHKKTHERRYKCQVETCKYFIEGFPTSKECERHQNDIHAPDSKEWKCEFSPCQYKSKRESNCKQHMEKAHDYTYKRMKRNPRKRDNGVQVEAPTPRKRHNVQSTQQPPLTPMTTSPAVHWPSKVVVDPQTPTRQPRTSFSRQEQSPTDQSFGFIQQPHAGSLGSIDLLQPTQMQDITDDLYQGSMAYHSVGTGQPYCPDSPDTATEYELSPVMTSGSAYENYSMALRGHPDTSPTLASGSLYQSQSAEQYMEHFLSEFPNGDNGFGIPQQNCQLTTGDFPYHSLDFPEPLDCERGGDTPD